ncbi:hypothetical protein V8F20_004271 [Naviculisporaceae sp. PSN 640]
MGRHTRGGRGGRGGNRGGHSDGNGDGGNNNSNGSNTGNDNRNAQQTSNHNQNTQNNRGNDGQRNFNTNNQNVNNNSTSNQNVNGSNQNFSNNNQNFNGPAQNFNNNNQNNRPPKRNRDDTNDVADSNPRKRQAPAVRTKFTQRDIQNTLNEARRLVREYKKAEKMVNSLMPRDNRTLWRFMNIQKEGMNAVKMCYYLHHTIIDPEGDYKMEVTDAKACDCNNADPGGKGIPECYLLALFYLVCATNYESGLFNFRTPVETKIKPEDGQVLNGELYIRPVETTGEQGPSTWLDR